MTLRTNVPMEFGPQTLDPVTYANLYCAAHGNQGPTPQHPLTAAPVVAGVNATALGALGMTKAGIQPQLLLVNWLGTR